MNKQLKQLSQVRDFHSAFGHPVGLEPKFPNSDRCALRIHLINEEAEEFSEAVMKQDIVEAADAICDLLYVIYGAALEFGLGGRLEEMFDEVHRSNMSKLDDKGRPITRADGKTMKSLNFTPPDLKSIINR